MTDRSAVATTKRVTQNFSLEDASLLCSSIEQWQKAHEIGINQEIDWLEVNYLLNKKLEVYGRSFTHEECRECWKFLAYGAALPAFGQQKDSWIFQNCSYLHPKPAVEKFTEATNKNNVISVISTDESSQAASESGDMKDAELKSQNQSLSGCGDASSGLLTQPEASTQSKADGQSEGATNPLDIVCSKARELYPPMNRLDCAQRVHSISPLPISNESKAVKKNAALKVENLLSTVVMKGFLDNHSEIEKSANSSVNAATSVAPVLTTPVNTPACHVSSLTSLLAKKKGRPSTGSRSPSPRDETPYSNSSSPTSSFSSSESSSQDSKPFASISAGELLYMAITGKYKHGKTKVATIKPKAKPASASKEKSEAPIVPAPANSTAPGIAAKAVVESKLASPKKELKRKVSESKQDASSSSSSRSGSSGSLSGTGSGSLTSEPVKPAAKKRKQAAAPKAAAGSVVTANVNPFRSSATAGTVPLSVLAPAIAAGAECVGLNTLLEAISTVHSQPKSKAMPPAMPSSALSSAMSSGMSSVMSSALSSAMSSGMYIQPIAQPLHANMSMPAQIPAAYAHYMTAPPMPVYGMEPYRHLMAPTSMAAISGSLPQMHMLMNSCAPMQSVHGHMQNLAMQSMPMQSMPSMQSMPPMANMSAMPSMQAMQPMLPVQQKNQMQGYPEAL